MDFTTVNRTTIGGNGIGSNFGSIPYNNNAAGNGGLSEFRLSAQNSRIGARFDSSFHGAHVLGYWESDFLGNNAASVAVTSNADTFRLRLYWVDITKDHWELLAGQSWSLMTPGRTGISPLPSNIFYSQDTDVNYQAGPGSRAFALLIMPTKPGRLHSPLKTRSSTWEVAVAQEL
jgi:hypothetical protein